MSIDQLYYQSCINESDIHEHLPTLYNYAMECNSVVEFGVRDTANSTRAFVKALVDNSRNGAQNLSYIGVDLTPCRVDYIQHICNQNSIDYMFVIGDSAKVSIPETDLLFIDSWHIYGHLKRELAKHHSKAKKYIIMHDTTVFEWRSESFHWSETEHTHFKNILNMTDDEINKGLWYAVAEFLKNNTSIWKIDKRYTNNNGLTILKKKPSKGERNER